MTSPQLSVSRLIPADTLVSSYIDTVPGGYKLRCTRWTCKDFEHFFSSLSTHSLLSLIDTAELHAAGHAALITVDTPQTPGDDSPSLSPGTPTA